MPTFENVSYNSSRVQRAYRINNIEQIRLQGRLHLLDKERIHRQRLTNQDIRLISLTLDIIRTCSGQSAEGLSPDSVSVYSEGSRKETGPCFLYGERIISRKAKRRSSNIRPQSAFGQSQGSRVDSDAASTASSVPTSFRPQSSPMRKRPTFITSLNKEDDVDRMSTSSGSHSDIWDEEPSDITKMLLRAHSSDAASRRESVFNRDRNSIRSSAAIKALTRNIRNNPDALSENQKAVQTRSMSSVNDRRGSDRPPRSSKITDLITQGRATMSASAWKANLASNVTPMTSSLQNQIVMDTKKTLNRSRTDMVQDRVKQFIKR